MRCRFGATILATLALCWLTGRPASASCAGLPPLTARLSDARVAFVGTVLVTAREQRLALVQVEAVWKGPGLPPVVEVAGGPDLLGQPPPFAGGSATADDRRYRPGERYLFMPISGPPFEESDCSGTVAYSPAVAAVAPANARSPDHSGQAEIGALAERLRFTLASSWWPLPLLLVAIAVLPVLALWRLQRD